ncbi:MAG: KGK domain-containing protein [Cyanobacteria bacterium J06636_27]
MNDKSFSIPLDCDDDVVSFEKDAFKVSRLKELAIRQVRKETHYYNKHLRKNIPNFSGFSIGEENFKFNYTKFETIKDCQILQANGKGWQKGKINIEVGISIDTDKPDLVNLKFFPEQPTEPESPLDDIREMIQVTDGA